MNTHQNYENINIQDQIDQKLDHDLVAQDSRNIFASRTGSYRSDQISKPQSLSRETSQNQIQIHDESNSYYSRGPSPREYAQLEQDIDSQGQALDMQEPSQGGGSQSPSAHQANIPHAAASSAGPTDEYTNNQQDVIHLIAQSNDLNSNNLQQIEQSPSINMNYLEEEQKIDEFRNMQDGNVINGETFPGVENHQNYSYMDHTNEVKGGETLEITLSDPFEKPNQTSDIVAAFGLGTFKINSFDNENEHFGIDGGDNHQVETFLEAIHSPKLDKPIIQLEDQHRNHIESKYAPVQTNSRTKIKKLKAEKFSNNIENENLQEKSLQESMPFSKIKNKFNEKKKSQKQVSRDRSPNNYIKSNNSEWHLEQAKRLRQKQYYIKNVKPRQQINHSKLQIQSNNKTQTAFLSSKNPVKNLRNEADLNLKQTASKSQQSFYQQDTLLQSNEICLTPEALARSNTPQNINARSESSPNKLKFQQKPNSTMQNQMLYESKVKQINMSKYYEGSSEKDLLSQVIANQQSEAKAYIDEIGDKTNVPNAGMERLHQKEIFHRDQRSLSKEMINVTAVKNIIKHNETMILNLSHNCNQDLHTNRSDQSKKRLIRGGTKVLNQKDLTRNMNSKQRMQLDQRNWEKVVKKLEKNPQQLMDMIPSPKGSSTSAFASRQLLSKQAYNDLSVASNNEMPSSRMEAFQAGNPPNNFEFYQNMGKSNQRGMKHNQGIYTNSKQNYGKKGQLGRSTIASLSSKSLASASNAAITLNQGYNQTSLESLNSINDNSIQQNGDIFGNELDGGIYGLAVQNTLGNEPKSNHRNQITIPRTLSNSNIQNTRLTDNKIDPYGNFQPLNKDKQFESHREPFSLKKQSQSLAGLSKNLAQNKQSNTKMPSNSEPFYNDIQIEAPNVLNSQQKGMMTRKSSHTVMRGVNQGFGQIQTQKLLQQNDPNSSLSQINFSKDSNFMSKRVGNQKLINEMVKSANFKLSGSHKNLSKLSSNPRYEVSRNQMDETSKNLMQTPEEDINISVNFQHLGSIYDPKNKKEGPSELHIRKHSLVDKPIKSGTYKTTLTSQRQDQGNKSIDQECSAKLQKSIQFPAKKKRTKTRSKKREITPMVQRVLPKPTEPLNQTSLEQSSTIIRQSYWQIRKKQRNSQDLKDQIKQQIRYSSQNKSQLLIGEHQISNITGRDKSKDTPVIAENSSEQKQSLKIQQMFSRKSSQSSVPPGLAESQEFINAKAIARKSMKILAKGPTGGSSSQKKINNKKPQQSNGIASLGPILGPNAASGLKMPKDLSNLDFSVQKLQNEAHRYFSNYELSNISKMQRHQIEQEKLEAERLEKIKNYSLAVDLFDKFKDKRAELNAAEQFKKQYFAQEENSTEFQVIDWKESKFYQKVVNQNISAFNSDKNPNVLSEEQLEYTINLLRYCGAKDFNNLTKLMPVFKKASATLEALMRELEIPFLYTRMVQQIKQVDVEQTLKILVRAKLLIPCRHKLIKIFNSVKDHENALLKLNMAVVNGDEEGSEFVGSERSMTSTARSRDQRDKRDKTIKSKIQQLEQSTKLSTQLIENLLSERKIFGTRFVFDGMNYLDVVNQELEQIKEIIKIYNTKSVKIDQENALKLLNKIGQKEIILEVGENEEDQDTPQSTTSKII